MEYRIAEIVRIINPTTKSVVSGDARPIGITTNAENVSDKTGFMAIKGISFDGHQLIPSIICKHPPVIIFSDPQFKKYCLDTNYLVVTDTKTAHHNLCLHYYQPTLAKIKLIGITGTNGKTSICHILAQGFLAAGIPCGMIGTLGAFFHDRFIPTRNTTPNFETICRILHQMVAEGIKVVMMEVSSHALDQKRVEGLSFHACLFTNLTQDHLDYHQTMEAYYLAKEKLFFRHSTASTFFYINIDDDFGTRLYSSLKGRSNNVTAVTSSNSPDKPASFSVQISKMTPSAMTCVSQQTIDGQELPPFSFTSSLIGKYNATNLALAFSCLLDFNLNRQAIIKGLQSVSIPGRLELASSKLDDIFVYIDFAHTHIALESVLATLQQIDHNRLICIFGCGGDRDKNKRPLMAKAAEKYCDFTVITSDNPRSESPVAIIADVEQGFSPFYMKNRIERQPLRELAIENTLLQAEENDIILIAGKGHETTQTIGNCVRPFNDLEQAKKILTKRRQKKSDASKL